MNKDVRNASVINPSGKEILVTTELDDQLDGRRNRNIF